MWKTEQVKQKCKYCCQKGYQQLSGRKEKPCSWGNRVNGWSPRNSRKIWQWSKCCKHLPVICDTSGHGSAWISAGVACSSLYLPSTDLMLCHSVPKGSLIPPMLSCLVCSSLTLFAAFCSEGTRDMLLYLNDWKKKMEKRNLSQNQEADPNRNHKHFCVLAACVGNPCSFQGSGLSSESKPLLSHSILPPDEVVTLRKTASVEQ